MAKRKQFPDLVVITEQERCIYCGWYNEGDEQNWDGVCPNCNFLMGIGELDDIEPYTYWDAEEEEASDG